MDAFDRAFQKCSKDEKEAILALSPEEFAKEFLKSLRGDDE